MEVETGKRRTYRLLIITTTFVALFYSLNLLAQDKEVQLVNNSTNTVSTSDPIRGYWELSGTYSENFSDKRITSWVSDNGMMVGTSRWIDVLNIEHTVSSSFKWDSPPQILYSGIDVKLGGSYVNNEYSTTERMKTGMKVYSFIGKEGESGKGNTDLLKMVKDNKLHESENKMAFFIPPNYYSGDTREMKIIVDCYIGRDHYITTFDYLFVDK